MTRAERTDEVGARRGADGRVAFFSILLVFFTVPHVLEDFALGEPQQRGVPLVAVATVVSTLLGAQGLGLYWLGQRRLAALWLHAVLGALWPIAAAGAQLPAILGPEPYRSGLLSVFYVLGILIVGPALVVSSLAGARALRGASSSA